MGLFSSLGSVAKSIGGGISSAFDIGSKFLDSGLGQAATTAVTGYGGYLADKEAQRRQAQYNKAAETRKYHRDVRAFKNRYEWTMDSMRAAGLNPILAYQQGGGSPTGAAAIGAGAPSGTAASLIGAVSSARGQRAQEKMLAEQTKEVQSRTALNEQHWHKSIVEQENLSRLNAKLEEEIKLVKEQLKQNYAVTARAQAEEQYYNTPLGQRLRQYEMIKNSIGLPDLNFGPRRR